eukprot:248049-Hanusia_phi.AAC.1
MNIALAISLGDITRSISLEDGRLNCKVKLFLYHPLGGTNLLMKAWRNLRLWHKVPTCKRRRPLKHTRVIIASRRALRKKSHPLKHRAPFRGPHSPWDESAGSEGCVSDSKRFDDFAPSVLYLTGGVLRSHKPVLGQHSSRDVGTPSHGEALIGNAVVGLEDNLEDGVARGQGQTSRAMIARQPCQLDFPDALE